MRNYFWGLWLLVLTLNVWSQESQVQVLLKDGQQQLVPLGQIEKMVFITNQTGALRLELVDSSTQEAALTRIRKISFFDITRVQTNRPDPGNVISTFVLYQNFPNPFNQQTTIFFELFEPQWTNLSIVNLRGQHVRNLYDNYAEAGLFQIVWDGANDSGETVSSGIYFYKLAVAQSIQMKKCLLIE